MPKRRALERLHAYQAEALELIARAEAMLAEGGPRDTANLARTRWALMRSLTAYQLFKHRQIFDPALAQATPTNALRLTRMKQACTEMGEAFRVHVQRWSGADTLSEWPAYRTDAVAMIARLRTHIARERSDVEGLLTTGRPGASITPPTAVPLRPGRPTPVG